MLSSLIPLVYVPKPPGGERAIRKCTYFTPLSFGRVWISERTIELINQYGSKDLVRVALGTRNRSLCQRFR
jgi:hypothetical protein